MTIRVLMYEHEDKILLVSLYFILFFRLCSAMYILFIDILLS